MNASQMDVLAQRLAGRGFRIRHSNSIAGSSPEGVVHVDPRGFCWAAFDPRDIVLPVLPILQSVPKEGKPLQEIMGLYFQFAKSKSQTILRLSTRIESSTLWKALRASNNCGLTPDEHAVISFLIGNAEAEFLLVTDYPTESSTMRTYGRKRFYESRLSPQEALSTLRSVAHKSSRNSYLPRDGAITFNRFKFPSRDELTRLFGSLGEWCYFQPV
jgi:hypothetical protein